MGNIRHGRRRQTVNKHRVIEDIFYYLEWSNKDKDPSPNAGLKQD